MMVRIVVNESLKFLKRDRQLESLGDGWDVPDTVEDEPDAGDIPSEVLQEMICRLPAGYRAVFNLYVFERKSHKEIAAMLNIKESTSASQLHRAKAVLAKEVQRYKLRSMEDKWLNEWQKKLDGYESSLRRAVDGINKALEEQRLSVSSSRGRSTVWLRLAGIAAALAIVVPLGRNVCQPVFMSFADNRIPTEGVLLGPTDAFWAKVQRVEKEPCRRKPSGKDIVACDRPAVSEEGGKALAEERKELLAEREKTIPEDSHGNSGKPYPDGIGRYPELVPNVGKVKKERSHWLAVSLFASNTPGKSVMNYGNGGVVLMGTIPSWGHPEAMECGKFPVTAIRSAHRYVDGVVPMKHKQPVRFGVSACYAVNEKVRYRKRSFLYLSFVKSFFFWRRL